MVIIGRILENAILKKLKTFVSSNFLPNKGDNHEKKENTRHYCMWNSIGNMDLVFK